MIEFSTDLDEIYQFFAKKYYDKKNVRKDYYNCPINEDESLKHLKNNFPPHLAKAREIFKNLISFPKSCGIINILDIGCGPYTFSQSIIDELIWTSKELGGGAYKINIKGVDLSPFQLKLGREMLNKWQVISEKKGWILRHSQLLSNVDFNSTISEITNWIQENPSDYFIIGISASISSGIFKTQDLLKKVISILKSDKIIIIIIEPHYIENKNDLKKILDLIKSSEIFNYGYKKLTFSLKKPKNMEGSKKKKEIKNAKFQAITAERVNKIVFNLLTKRFSNEIYNPLLISLNKTLNWLNCAKLTDFISLFLYKIDYSLSIQLLYREIVLFKKIDYPTYDVRKGLEFRESRNLIFVPVPSCVLCMILIDYIGKKLDAILSTDIYGSRLIQKFTLNWDFRHYAKLYKKFNEIGYNHFGLGKKLLIFKTDISDYFGSIIKEQLRTEMEVVFNSFIHVLNDCLCFNFENQDRCKSEILNLLVDLLGSKNVRGIPIGLPFSPIFANLYLNNLDESIRNNNSVLEYGRYIDDIRIVLSIEDNDDEKESFKTFIKNEIEKYNLEIKQKKTEFSLLNKYLGNSQLIKSNSELKNLSSSYLKIIYPILFIGDSLWRLKKFGTNLSEFLTNINKIIDKIINALNGIGIFFDNEYLIKTIATTLIHIQGKYFEKKLQNRFRIFKPISLPEDIDSISSEELSEKFKCLNNNWYGEYIALQNLMYTLLSDEILKWEFLIDLIEKLHNFPSSEKYNEEYNNLKKKILSNTKTTKFELSFRKIRFLAYRLSTIKSIALSNRNEKTLVNLLKFDLICFPIKLAGLLCFRYGHIDLLKKNFFKSLNNQKHPLTDDDDICPQIYGNEIGYLLHLLGLHYENKLDCFNDNEWKDYLQKFLEEGQIELKLAATEFILRLKIANLWEYEYWINRIKNESNIFVFKNLVLCLLYHNNSPETIPKEIIPNILENYKQDESLIVLIMSYWTRFKKNNLNSIFNTQNPLLYINVKNIELELEAELLSDFEIEEGFDIFDFYEYFDNEETLSNDIQDDFEPESVS